MIGADIMFGDYRVRPVVDCAHLTEKPACDVLAGENQDPDISVWIHEPFAEMVRKGSRYEFELDPSKKENANRPAQTEPPAPGVKPRQDGKFLRDAMHQLK